MFDDFLSLDRVAVLECHKSKNFYSVDFCNSLHGWLVDFIVHIKALLAGGNVLSLLIFLSLRRCCYLV